MFAADAQAMVSVEENVLRHPDDQRVEQPVVQHAALQLQKLLLRQRTQYPLKFRVDDDVHAKPPRGLFVALGGYLPETMARRSMSR